jgi:LPXTG-site transpeptidase (sortase) family protein
MTTSRIQRNAALGFLIIPVVLILLYLLRPLEQIVYIRPPTIPPRDEVATSRSTEPIRISIPAIGVDTPVEHVGLAGNGSGEMGTPLNALHAGWYDRGPRPGDPGSAVIDGHSTGRGVREAVFYSLGDLQPGDEIHVMDSARTTRTFMVTRIETYDYTASTNEIFMSGDGASYLNLITCSGSWLPTTKRFDKRIVVFSEFVGERDS